MSKCPAMTGPIHERGECFEKDSLNPPKALCNDWLVVSGDAHYARDSSAFKTSLQIGATVGEVKVIGIGTSTYGGTKVRIVLDGNPQDESVLEENKGMGRVAVFFTAEEPDYIKSWHVWEAHLKT